jgi:hypothetical protein
MPTTTPATMGTLLGDFCAESLDGVLVGVVTIVVTAMVRTMVEPDAVTVCCSVATVVMAAWAVETGKTGAAEVARDAADTAERTFEVVGGEDEEPGGDELPPLEDPIELSVPVSQTVHVLLLYPPPVDVLVLNLQHLGPRGTHSSLLDSRDMVHCIGKHQLQYLPPAANHHTSNDLFHSMPVQAYSARHTLFDSIQNSAMYTFPDPQSRWQKRSSLQMS